METQTRNWDINRPWLTLDPWQEEYVFDPNPNKDNFLLSGRQCGKTTAMSLRAVELCVNHFKHGELVLLNSITEKQAHHLLLKAKIYAEQMYPKLIIEKGPEKPTMHKLMFNLGTKKKPIKTGILCYAAGESGDGQRGFTIKKLMVDEGSRMSEEYFIAVMPMLSVITGSMDIASTPHGKKHPDGSDKFFYKCSKDEKFQKYFISGEECPRHSKEFLDTQKERMTKLAYAQEYLAIFTDELKRVFSDELLKEICILNRSKSKDTSALGVDVAGLGEDQCTYEVLTMDDNGKIMHRESVIETRNYTTDTTKKILEMNRNWDFSYIGIDDGGVGFGVYSELMVEDDTKWKTSALNNSSRPTNADGTKSKRILKEEMYSLLLSLMENKKIFLLNDDEVISSLASIQHDEGRINGANSHVAEGIIRAVWLLANNKSLKLSVYSIKV